MVEEESKWRVLFSDMWQVCEMEISVSVREVSSAHSLPYSTLVCGSIWSTATLSSRDTDHTHSLWAWNIYRYYLQEKFANLCIKLSL